MRMGFATAFDATDVIQWSGTPMYMAKNFQKHGVQIEYLGNLETKLPPFFKLKKKWKRMASSQRESATFNIEVNQHYAKQIQEKLKNTNVDVIFAPLINPICYLDCKQPIVLWTDALYASLLGFYPKFSDHSSTSIHHGNTITKECLSRLDLAIFSSPWGARTATEIYGMDKKKIHVVPFGANVESDFTLDEIKTMISHRSRQILKLLFIGKEWHRKGGDIVFDVVKALHQKGQAVELNFIGCYPPKNIDVPHHIHCHGFISKRTREGQQKINDLLRESHFLFVPSRAEAFGIVFCEANAFALPVLTSYTGGISFVIENEVNGMTFPLASPTDVYCDYIMNLFNHPNQYEALCLSSYQHYQKKLNWEVTTRQVIELIQQI